MLRSVIMFFYFTLLLSACREREESVRLNPGDAFTGSWQQTYDLNSLGSCDPNLDCKCADVINFYAGNTFDRNNQCDYKKGYFQLTGNKIRLVYLSENPQIFEYRLEKNELFLVKEDVEYRYVKKPYKVRMEEAR